MIHKSLKNITAPGRYAFGDGLYLSVSQSNTRSWLFQYRSSAKGAGSKRKVGNRVVQMGLGTAESLGRRGKSLRAARAEVEHLRKLIAKGEDPLLKKQREQRPASDIKFGEYADGFFDRIKDSFENEKHREQWQRSLKVHCKPLRKKPVAHVTVEDVRAVLAPLWVSIPETASRVRGRLDRIFNSAKAEGIYPHDNPAALAIHQAILGRSIASMKLTKHHPAIPYKEAPAFMKRLRALGSVSALALEFLILTVARTSEVTGAKPDEIDRSENIWTVPASRMKARRRHYVPLIPRAIKILDKVTELPGNYIFPGAKDGESLSNMAMAELLKGLHPGVTVHGMRSAFRDWAGDCTDFDGETIEFCLAHNIDDKTEAAYRRGTAVEKRRKLLAEWSAYLG